MECCCPLYGSMTPAPKPTPTPQPAACTSGGYTGCAKTTRYWDCCKPSCAWSSNVKSSVAGYTAVRTCKQSGAYASGNGNSICGGGGDGTGPEYMCTNQQPSVVADTMYGFAASNTLCCACFELVFLSYSVDSKGKKCTSPCSAYTGQLAGKKMIVQVTNKGGDLGNAHFDLQIPGGGLGIFNGCAATTTPKKEPACSLSSCPAQFSQAYNVWGKRYGGVTASSGCSSLPAALQSGCQWRFGSFKNADNPGVKYKRIACPTKLTDISKCKRVDDATLRL